MVGRRKLLSLYMPRFYHVIHVISAHDWAGCTTELVMGGGHNLKWWEVILSEPNHAAICEQDGNPKLEQREQLQQQLWMHELRTYDF